MGMNLEAIFLVPCDIFCAPRLRADVVLAKDAPGGQKQREAWPGALVRWHIFGDDEIAQSAHETAHMHDGRAFGRRLVAGPLDRTQCIEFFVSYSGECWRQSRDLVHDLGRMIVMHRIT